MSKVFVFLGMSLDGYIAGPNNSLENMGGDGWMDLHEWLLEQRVLRQNLKLGEGGQTGPENQFVESILARTGVSIMGKRMFNQGEVAWPEEAPFHTPVFVVTHEVREPWVRKGGTTFHFINDGIQGALRRAFEVAGEKDIRIAGGGSTVIQYVNAGLVDELFLAVAPTFLGVGLRLFEGIDKHSVTIAPVEAISWPKVTLLRYAIQRAGASRAQRAP
ncbi:dihydrofolate reductase family protein [Pendulispora brunnea]|uniref:Dihydrofolate reductase family protein n=1 Tax=Pendulispora brunnea TaxID=2905690 RepID=A0ABZ2KA76_9BACT